MRRETLRELLNRLRWSPAEHEEEAAITVAVRRGGLDVEDVVALGDVQEIGAAGIVLFDDTFLPYHRITQVTAAGRPVWRSPRGTRR